MRRSISQLLLLLLLSCGSKDVTPTVEKPVSTPMPAAEPPSATTQTFTVVERFPHDTTAFTQGLVWKNGFLYESTGLNGRSSVRKVELKTGKVVDRTGLDPIYFAEGLAVIGDKLYQITWLNQRGFVYDIATLTKRSEFSYMGEGWGLASDGTVLYKSNGTDVITVHDKTDFKVMRTLNVVLNGKPCGKLNELEWVDGELWANVWQSDVIVRIDPNSGIVKSMIDCTGLLGQMERNGTADVQNGIAYDAEKKAIYVTGKNWPWLYQIQVK